MDNLIVVCAQYLMQAANVLKKFLDDLLAKTGKIRGLTKDLSKNYEDADTQKQHI